MNKEMIYRGIKFNINKKRVCRLSIRVKNDEVFVSVPFLTTDSEIKKLIDDYYDWIIKKLDNKKISISYGNPIYIVGEKYNLVEVENKDKKIMIDNNSICISGPNEKERRKLFDKYCQKVLLEVFSDFKQFDVDIKFKDYKSKWGCCYPSKRVIYYNYRLASLPLEAIEYVYYHEMAHLKVRNHQKEFYQEVERLLPNYKVGLKQIKNYTI